MRTTRFHQIIVVAVAASALLLSACQGESPTSPGAGTPPGGGTPPPSGASVTLTASNENPLVQSTTTLTATVTQNGQPVPDGTAVEFQTNLGTFADTGGTISLRTTTNGVATAVLTSANAGTARVTARVNNVTATKDVVFRTGPVVPPPIVTSISSISPTRGGPAGGQEVIIRGQNFKAPVRVLFGDKPAAAILISSTEIRAVAPSTNLGPSTQFQEVDVIVISEAGTPTEQSATSPQKFRYELEVLQPAIITVSPTSGPNEGNTRVTIFGEGFSAPIKVFFGTSGAPGSPLQDEVEAEVQGAPTYNQVVVLTPPALGLGAELANKQVTIRVLNVLTGKDAVSNNIFRYGPSMQITAAGPTTLSPFGGDRVTIDGWGFDDPVAVSLAGVAAQPIFVSGTRIVVLAGRPLGCASETGPVNVTNIEDGTTANGPEFSYTDPVVSITAISPTTIAPGGTLTITVSGVTGTGSPRLTIGGSTLLAATSSVSGGIGTFTYIVPTNLTFATEACAAGGTRPIPTAFSLTFEESGSGCPSDTLAGALTVTPPQVGVLRLQPAALSFSATVGASDTDSFLIVNNGAGPLTINSVTTSGAPFTVTPISGQSLASCGSATANVTFTPTAPGAANGTAVVNTTAGTSTVTLTGTGTNPTP